MVCDVSAALPPVTSYSPGNRHSSCGAALKTGWKKSYTSSTEVDSGENSRCLVCMTLCGGVQKSEIPHVAFEEELSGLRSPWNTHFLSSRFPGLSTYPKSGMEFLGTVLSLAKPKTWSQPPRPSV